MSSSACIRYLVLAFVLTGLACAKQPPTHYYLLEAALPSADPAFGDDPALGGGIAVGVRALAVDTPYDEAGIVYRVGADSPEVAFYAYHEWASPLSRMLPRLIADALTGTSGIASIEPTAPGGRYDATIEGRLIALEEVDVAGRQQVRLRMILRLIQDGDEIWHETINAQATTQTDQVSRIVELMNETMLGAVGDLRGDVGTAVGNTR